MPDRYLLGGTVPSYTALDDDFLGDVLADQWNCRVGSDGQCVTAAVVAGGLAGICRMVAGDDAAATMAANGVQLESALNWKASQDGLALEARVKISAITSVAFFVGFTDQVSALEMPFTLSGTTLTSNASDAVGFLFDTDATTDDIWLVGVAADTDATQQDSGEAFAADTYLTLRVDITTAGAATFRIDGTVVGTTMTGAVTAATALTPYVGGFSRITATRNFDADYVYVRQVRG